MSECDNETGWDLQPGTFCCSACTWTNVSSSNKLQRNYKGLKKKLQACTAGANYEQQDTKRQKKKKKTQLPLLKSREQKHGVGSKSRVLRMTPHSTQPKGWAKHLSHPFGPTPGHTPALPPHKEPARPPLGEQAGNCYLFLFPPATAGAPVKPCLNFLSGL